LARGRGNARLSAKALNAQLERWLNPPEWIEQVAAKVDAADRFDDVPEDWAAVWVDSGAGQKLKAGHPLAAERARVDQAVLSNLLRLNRARSGDAMQD
jgi:hypothetical protein